MSGISSISDIGLSIGKGIAKSTKLGMIKNSDKKFYIDKDKAIGIATVTSILLKDGIGCAMYVTQSLNNKKIPEEKRKFVSALDLTNGILMILAQIGMFFAMRKYSGKFFESIFSKSFDAVAKSNMLARLRMAGAKARIKDSEAPLVRTIDSSKEFEKVKKMGSGLFEFIANTAAATIIGKRVIVPLIATPAASKVEKWMDKYYAKKYGESLKPQEEDKSNPSMKGNQQEAKIQTEEQPQAEIIEDLNTNLIEKYKQSHNA